MTNAQALMTNRIVYRILEIGIWPLGFPVAIPLYKFAGSHERENQTICTGRSFAAATSGGCFRPR